MMLPPVYPFIRPEPVAMLVLGYVPPSRYQRRQYRKTKRSK